MNFEPHQALLVKILNEAHVAQDISVEGFWDFWWEEVEAEGEAKSYQAKTIQVKD